MLTMTSWSVPQPEAVAPVVGEEDAVGVALGAQGQEVVPAPVLGAEPVDPGAVAAKRAVAPLVVARAVPGAQPELRRHRGVQLPDVRAGAPVRLVVVLG